MEDSYYEAVGEDFLDEELDEDAEDAEDAEEMEHAEYASDGAPILEERVLEAFNNDPILSERAIDIGAIGAGEIELEGWVDDDDEAEHAVVIARGVPGVVSVSNRLLVDEALD